jgi:hypothetical protein
MKETWCKYCESLRENFEAGAKEIYFWKPKNVKTSDQEVFFSFTYDSRRWATTAKEKMYNERFFSNKEMSRNVTIRDDCSQNYLLAE